MINEEFDVNYLYLPPTIRWADVEFSYRKGEQISAHYYSASVVKDGLTYYMEMHFNNYAAFANPDTWTDQPPSIDLSIYNGPAEKNKKPLFEILISDYMNRRTGASKGYEQTYVHLGFVDSDSSREFTYIHESTQGKLKNIQLFETDMIERRTYGIWSDCITVGMLNEVPDGYEFTITNQKLLDMLLRLGLPTAFVTPTNDENVIFLNESAPIVIRPYGELVEKMRLLFFKIAHDGQLQLPSFV